MHPISRLYYWQIRWTQRACFACWAQLSKSKPTKIVRLLQRESICSKEKLNSNLQLNREELFNASLVCSYASMLINDVPECAAYVKASIGLQTQAWFFELYKLPGSNSILDDAFDAACQCFMARLLICFEEYVLSNGSAAKTSFWFSIFDPICETATHHRML
mmetsp:Transcript_7742/g.11244  ORF Transcript_7742/g.11244 Transcript_7742/m.11244 type:complete len:162 (+) Transcript_7742:1075-1560(+)